MTLEISTNPQPPSVFVESPFWCLRPPHHHKKGLVVCIFVRPTCTNDSIERFIPLPHILNQKSSSSLHMLLVPHVFPQKKANDESHRLRPAEQTAGPSDVRITSEVEITLS